MAAERPFGPEPITTASYALDWAKVNVSSIADHFGIDRLVVYEPPLRVSECSKGVINTQSLHAINATQRKNGWLLLARQNPDRHYCVVAPPFRLTLLGHSPYFKTLSEIWRL